FSFLLLLFLFFFFSFFYFFFCFFFFFFSSRRRHTRSYGDWSSDVCSSDLCLKFLFLRACARLLRQFQTLRRARRSPRRGHVARRSEERRVGKECRSRWSTDH